MKSCYYLIINTSILKQAGKRFEKGNTLEVITIFGSGVTTYSLDNYNSPPALSQLDPVDKKKNITPIVKNNVIIHHYM